jgi:flagellar biogenesis protein FliO
MTEGSFFGSLIQMVLASGVVFGLLFGLRYYLLRNHRGLPSGGLRLIRVRERTQLGPRSFVYVIQAGKEVFMVCNTENAVEVTPLHSVDALGPDEPAEAAKTGFAANLYTAYEQLRQGRRE